MLVQYSDDSGEEAPEENGAKKERSLEKDTKPKRKKKRKKQKDGQEQQAEESIGVPNSPGPTSTLPSMEDIMKGKVAFLWKLWRGAPVLKSCDAPRSTSILQRPLRSWL
jgi:hypothetical protein